MTAFKKAEVVKAIELKGFRQDPKRTNHEVYYLYDENGKKTKIHTMFSHNNKDITDFMIGKMTKEFEIGKNDLVKYFKCTLSKDGYLKLLRENGVI